MPNNREYKIGDNKMHKSVTPHRGPGGHGPGGMRGTVEKPKDFKKSWAKLFSYIKSYMPIMIIALIFAITGTIFTLIGPDKLKDVTNLISSGVATGIDMDAVLNICILLVILYGGSFLLSYVQGFIMATVTQRITLKMRDDISKKINLLPLKYFDTNSYGDILSRVTNDVDIISTTLNSSLLNIITSITLLVGATIMMFVTNWILAVSSIGSALIGFLLMMIIIKKSQKHFDEQQKQLGVINGQIEEIYAGHNIVKAYNGEKKAKEIFDDTNKKLYNSAWKSRFLSGLMMPIMAFIGNLGFVAVCVVGGVLVFNGMEFGIIVAFLVYIRLFTRPLSQIAQAATNLQSTAAASERVFEFLGETELDSETSKKALLDINNIKGHVEFKNVVFGYDENKIIIHDFNAEAKEGQKIAIVGPTGAGKTTMVNLLMRFYEVNSGEILIDGVPVKNTTRDNIHDMFCMVLQDTWLFEGTIKENIIYSKKEVSDEEVVQACKAVGIHYFITTLPEGYNTVLNDKANLSAGQKQLITIARAMIENAPMLILDEATSSVDTRTEVLIQRAMDKLTSGRTSFIIAHRLSTIKNADLILVMNNGDIIEKGNHETLIEKNGFYADLYNSQFEKTA